MRVYFVSELFWIMHDFSEGNQEERHQEVDVDAESVVLLSLSEKLDYVAMGLAAKMPNSSHLLIC